MRISEYSQKNSTGTSIAAFVSYAPSVVGMPFVSYRSIRDTPVTGRAYLMPALFLFFHKRGLLSRGVLNK